MGKKKIFYLALLLFFGVSFISAQSNNANRKKSKKVKKTEIVYEMVDESPEFPGGQSALYTFLSENITYPLEAQKKGIEGRVLISFVVAKDGTIVEIKKLKKVHPILDAEAIRVVKLMPKWQPGKKDGEVVRVRLTLPINFQLPKKDLKY